MHTLIFRTTTGNLFAAHYSALFLPFCYIPGIRWHTVGRRFGERTRRREQPRLYRERLRAAAARSALSACLPAFNALTSPHHRLFTLHAVVTTLAISSACFDPFSDLPCRPATLPLYPPPAATSPTPTTHHAYTTAFACAL